jgi:hypothetical protein
MSFFTAIVDSTKPIAGSLGALTSVNFQLGVCRNAEHTVEIKGHPFAEASSHLLAPLRSWLDPGFGRRQAQQKGDSRWVPPSGHAMLAQSLDS